jgi:hypothetical protein
VGQRIEQARTGEECGRIEARLVGIGTLLAIAGHRSVDQPRIERGHIGVAHPEPSADLEREIHHHDIGGLDQPVEHAAALVVLEVEHDRPLVTVHQVPAKIDRMLRDRMSLAQLALRIALPGGSILITSAP